MENNISSDYDDEEKIDIWTVAVTYFTFLVAFWKKGEIFFSTMKYY